MSILIFILVFFGILKIIYAFSIEDINIDLLCGNYLDPKQTKNLIQFVFLLDGGMEIIAGLLIKSIY